MPAAAAQSRLNTTPAPAAPAPVVLVGPWSASAEERRPSVSEAAPAPSSPPAAQSADPLLSPASPTRLPARARRSTGLRWWSDLTVGLALRAGEALLVLAAPALLLWRHRRAAALTTLRVAAPAVAAFFVQGWLATGNAASMPPWASPAAAGTFALLYVASAVGLIVAVAMARTALAGMRRWLDDIARYGAANRPPR